MNEESARTIQLVGRILQIITKLGIAASTLSIFYVLTVWPEFNWKQKDLRAFLKEMENAQLIKKRRARHTTYWAVVEHLPKKK